MNPCVDTGVAFKVTCEICVESDIFKQNIFNENGQQRTGGYKDENTETDRLAWGPESLGRDKVSKKASSRGFKLRRPMWWRPRSASS